jgi:hypothetical protein
VADELITAPELSAEKKIPEKTLAQWRYLGRGPRYLKLEGHVRYRRSDVAAWEADCERGVHDGAA